MTGIYLGIFICVCIGLLIWGLAKPYRIYQFPFFMGAIFLVFAVPQAIAITTTWTILTLDMINRVLVTSIACVSMCWLGYQFTPHLRHTVLKPFILDETKFIQAGVILATIGNFFFNLVSTLASNNTHRQWTGPITIYSLFVNVSNIAFAILFMMAIRRSSWKLFLCSVFAAYPLLHEVFESGRRQKTATLLILVAIVLFYERRIVPSRLFVLAIIGATALLIPLIGMIRGTLWEQILSGNFHSIEWTIGIERIFQGVNYELQNAAVLIEAAIQTDKYGWGTGYWDAIVFQFVPGQLIGYDLKESLQFRWTANDLFYLFNYRISNGSTYTGIADSFMEFGYLGCLLFAIQAYFFKRLWLLTTTRENQLYRVLYMGLISSALVGVTHGTYRLVQELTFQVIIVLCVSWYAQRRTIPRIARLARNNQFHYGHYRRTTM